MSEWLDLQLGEVATFRKGINYTSSDYGDQDSGRPFITIKCFIKGGGYEPIGLKHIRGEFKEQDRLLPGDVLFSITDLTRAGDIVGSPLQIPFFGDDTYSVASMDCMRIEPDESVCNRDFLYQRMMLFDIRRRMVAYSAGSTVLHLDTKQVYRIVCRLPVDIRVQQKIACILQTIDQAIEKTEALIDKYQQIKAGLMHDLFTRGIGADGQLRPPREQAPELYQETPIGWIPKEWKLGVCEDVCEKIIDCKNRTPPITPDGYPVIRTPNVRNGLFVDDGIVYTDYESYLIWTARGTPQPGDVVITREAPVGEVCKIPSRHQHACLGQRMMLYRVSSEKIIEDFFLYALQSQPVQNRLDLISGGSTVGHVRVGDIRSLLIFYPEHHQEQLKITEALNAVFSKLDTETNILKKLQKQKSGLMHDLLTGKIPVQVEPEAAPETAHA